jgi:hypothetical protein
MKMEEYWILTAITLGVTVVDVELTQHCLANGLCREGNPLLPSNRGKVYAIQLPLAIGVSYIGHRWHKDGFKYWWVPQAAVIAGHGVGIGFGMRFVW